MLQLCGLIYAFHTLGLGLFVLLGCPAALHVLVLQQYGAMRICHWQRCKFRMQHQHPTSGIAAVVCRPAGHGLLLGLILPLLVCLL